MSRQVYNSLEQLSVPQYQEQLTAVTQNIANQGRGSSNPASFRAPRGRSRGHPASFRAQQGQPRADTASFRAPHGRSRGHPASFRAPHGRTRSGAASFRAQQGQPRADTASFRAPHGHPRADAASFRAPHGRSRGHPASFRAQQGQPRADTASFRAPHGHSRADAASFRAQQGHPRADAASFRALHGRTRSGAASFRAQQGQPRADTASFRAPHGHLRADAASFRAPHGHLRADAASFRAPHGHSRADAASFRAPHGHLRADAASFWAPHGHPRSNARRTIQRQNRKAVLKQFHCPFLADSTCYFKENPAVCRFSHALNNRNPEAENSPEVQAIKNIPFYACFYSFTSKCQNFEQSWPRLAPNENLEPTGLKGCRRGVHLSTAQLANLEQFERDYADQLAAFNRKTAASFGSDGDLECPICSDAVLYKKVPSNRKFALLQNCTHVFCYSCISKWRLKGSTACPFCRKTSNCVVASRKWIEEPDAKARLFANARPDVRPGARPGVRPDASYGYVPFWDSNMEFFARGYLMDSFDQHGMEFLNRWITELAEIRADFEQISSLPFSRRNFVQARTAAMTQQSNYDTEFPPLVPEEVDEEEEEEDEEEENEEEENEENEWNEYSSFFIRDLLPPGFLLHYPDESCDEEENQEDNTGELDE